MKNILIGLLIIAGIILVGSCKKDNNGDTPPANGTYSASGTISFKAGDTNYSIPIYTVNKTTNSLTIGATEVTDNISITVGDLTEISTGTYTTLSSTINLTIGTAAYNASVLKTSSECSINITKFSTSSIKGTFTATVVPVLGGTSNLSLTNGVINCTLGTKLTE
jgi:hypothetical protein